MSMLMMLVIMMMMVVMMRVIMMMFKVLDCGAPWWVARLTGEEFQLAERRSHFPALAVNFTLHCNHCEALRNNFKLAH